MEGEGGIPVTYISVMNLPLMTKGGERDSDSLLPSTKQTVAKDQPNRMVASRLSEEKPRRGR